jgi:hypothetical protein
MFGKILGAAFDVQFKRIRKLFAAFHRQKHPLALQTNKKHKINIIGNVYYSRKINYLKSPSRLFKQKCNNLHFYLISTAT